MTTVSADFEDEPAKPELPADWEPPEHQRIYYRHVQSADRGYLIREEGRDCIRLDRPNERIVKAFQAREWIADKESRPMTVAQAAQIAQTADRQLCFFLGFHDLARKEWQGLSEEQKIAWMKDGPTKNPARRAMYQAIRRALEPFVG